MRHDLRMWLHQQLIGRRLRSIERRLVPISTEYEKRHEPDVVGAQIALVLRGLAAAQTANGLFRRGFRQEAELAQRVFLESWIAMMHFEWFGDDRFFRRWWDNPFTWLSEREFKFKARVQAEFVRRYGNPVPVLPLKGFFNRLSNASVHPTRESTWNAHGEAKRRHGLLETIEGLDTVKLAALNVTLGRLRFLVHLSLFLRFLADWQKVHPTVPTVDSEWKWLDNLLHSNATEYQKQLNLWAWMD